MAIYVVDRETECEYSITIPVSQKWARNFLARTRCNVTFFMDEWQLGHLLDKLRLYWRYNFWPLDWHGPLIFACPGDIMVTVLRDGQCFVSRTYAKKAYGYGGRVTL